jgi:hypothetical protein
MIKNLLFVGFLMFSAQFLFTQTAHRYNLLSLGFNTREYIDTSREQVREYYILNNDRYSNVQINEWTELVTPGREVRYEFSRDSNTSFIVTFGGGIDLGGNDWRVGIIRNGPLTIIAQNNKIILEYENDLTGLKDLEIIRGRASNPAGRVPLNREILYNTPENIIEHKYLTLFTKYMVRLINLEHFSYINTSFDIERSPLIELLISRLKKHELAIIRNLLFARHSHAFKTAFWRDFMNIYYPKNYIGMAENCYDWSVDKKWSENWTNFMDAYYHENYIGLYTESEVVSQFDKFEQRLLEIIIEYENRHTAYNKRLVFRRPFGRLQGSVKPQSGVR